MQDSIHESHGAQASSLSSKPRLRRKAAAEYLRTRHGLEIAPATLAKWACLGVPSGEAPPFQRLGRFPYYDVQELDAWVERRLGQPVTNTSQLTS